MENPAIPLCISFKANIIKMQQLQNSDTNSNKGETRRIIYIADLRSKYKVDPINTSKESVGSWTES